MRNVNTWYNSARYFRTRQYLGPGFPLANGLKRNQYHLRLQSGFGALSRGVKSKSTVKLQELPQGALNPALGTAEIEEDGPAYPTVIRQARNNMRKFSNCVVLTKVGSFYELYFEQAEKYGPLLNLKVATRKGKAGVPLVPMAGFPFFQLDRFLKVLVQDLNQYVAISEEFANDVSGKVKSGELLFDRRVTRIITPGTLIDEKFMNPYENNFLLAVHPAEEDPEHHPRAQMPIELRSTSFDPSFTSRPVGLAWLDLSTGEFLTQKIQFGSLTSAITRIGAREIVVSDGVDGMLKQLLSSMIEQGQNLLTYHSAHNSRLPISAWSSMLETEVAAETQESFSSEETAAGSLLLTYVKQQLQGLNIKLQPPQRRQEDQTMTIDKNSLRGLEVLATSREGIGGGKGSLLSTVRRTVTKSGTRLLKDWITSPSTSLQIINARLDLVSHLARHASLREDLVNLLRKSADCQRLVQKFSLGRGDADDLVSLLRTIEVTRSVASILESWDETAFKDNDNQESNRHFPLQTLFHRFSLEGPSVLANQISTAIDEEGLIQSHRREESESANIVSVAQDVLKNEGSPEEQEAMSQVARIKTAHTSSIEQEADEDDAWIMRKNASQPLQRLHDSLFDLRVEKEKLEVALRDETGAQSLTLRWTPGSGYVCHVKGARDVRNSAGAALGGRHARSTKSTRTFYNNSWTHLGSKMDHFKTQIRAEEQHLLRELREKVVINLVKLRRNAAVLDELDIACAFATLAEEQGFIRPILNMSKNHKVIGGRHPSVKIGLEEEGRSFVGNDCLVGEKERLWLITGPNMGGKSTFLRQNALISILAQAGSFVPADHAEIGIVDQILTRVGSADNLYKDQSTFMVEMLETALILNQATSRSFVIMDEIGRGTTSEDGIAVAFACLHHLYHHNRCRTLFATHFHVLADLARDFPNMACYCTDVAEGMDGSFSYVHRLRRGVNRRSHALKVARLAGIPESAIQMAQNVLEKLEPQIGALSDRQSRAASSDDFR